MKVIAVVPMKLNSERLPNKNIKPFDNGLPLCSYILNTLLSIDEIDDVYVYCSNPEIINYIPKGVKYLTRSQSLDRNTTKINEVLLSFANDVPADIYVMAHTTAPFIKKDSIVAGVCAVLSKNYDSAYSAEKLQEFLWKDEQPFNYTLDNIPRTQDLQPLYKETSGFYIYSSDIIKNCKMRIGNKPFLVEVGKIESIDIDEKEDFDIANAIYNYLLKEFNYDEH